MLDLVQKLVETTGVSQEQAQGGAGLLFQLAKKQLSSEEFSQLSGAIPGLDSLLSAAPQADQGHQGLMDSIKGFVSHLGGGNLGNLAELADGFAKLGLDKEMILQFVPVVISFVQQQGGDAIAAKLKTLFGSE